MERELNKLQKMQDSLNNENEGEDDFGKQKNLISQLFDDYSKVYRIEWY
jgi:uncharacterized membrane-anchored protein YhcB (DUF1043 family)